jgi:GntR family transcriptional regulator / MocR family aminotransferase
LKNTTAIWLDRDDAQSLQNQLVRQIRQLIEAGTLRSREAMPSTRELAHQLSISRNTVVYAYDRLVSEGYLDSQPRAGMFISTLLDGLSRQPAKAITATGSKQATTRPQPLAKGLSAPTPFRPCQPDVSLFPLQFWNRLRGQVLRESGSRILHYQEGCRLGLPELRRAIAEYVRANRGVHCDPHQVAITTGSQQALFLLGAMLLTPKSRVYIEEPGYPGAQLAFANAGAHLDPGAIDEEGLQIPVDGKTLYTLLYTTPSRQFPTGVSMSLRRRIALLEYAHRTKSWIVEDDYDSEFRYSAPPLPSLQSLDRFGRVIYVGTFSKVLFPSLRIGYVVLPIDLVEGFTRIRSIVDDHGPLMDQATLARFIDSGAFHTHIRRCRRAYRERQQSFLHHAQQKSFPFTFRYIDGGMNLTALLPKGTSDVAWSERCSQYRLDVPPLSRYATHSCAPGLIFGFTSFTPAEIRTSLDKLERIFSKSIAVSPPADTGRGQRKT